ncbi:MAG: hypothetical protein ACRELF_27980, partial [Gemmataceae bacterium]
MPLRDHFRPPLDNAHSWEELHGGWPMVIVQHLRTKLPAGYVAEPRVHSGSYVVIDIAADDRKESVATAEWAPPRPSVDVETTLPDFYEYEARPDADQRRQH